EDLVLEAEAHDVPDDQEVAGEIQLLDHRQLFGELRLRAGRQRAEARARPVPRDLTQERAPGLPRGQRTLGKAVAQICQSEVETLRELPCPVQSDREIAEKRLHPRGVFEVALSLLLEEPARAIECGVVADRREDVRELFVLGSRVA